ncbi:imidazolonepropionase [Tistlia consotensis]|uniref:Imidazolonepropionase n=1 Tax=Tistlia consotensis USBA 355 TaxID=560819 RepID=A0A1Y6BR25_9PROT|nr:imidazolonepropionase [Tistlia consotensis]SMF16685.1 imidazolonepropionase [Tistlia consotensis USBA 355]SNR40939.1 imidazolonepropionase [Tistlia consotensis]
MWDSVLINARLATMVPGKARYGAIESGALGIANGRIAWIGALDDLTARPGALAKRIYDLDGRWVTPGLIDCHTHLVHGGDRAGEFEQRLGGASYAEIARAGGGILSTVRATRAADEEALFAASLPRLQALMAEGVTTVEIKSGYGLEPEQEVKQLRVARRLGESQPVTVHKTFLGAHAVPPEFKDDPNGYLQTMIGLLPRLAQEKLADSVDAFCETIAFDADQVARLFESASALGLPVRLHADQLTDGGGAALAARFKALSAEHLEYANEHGIRAMAKAGTVAVLLPGAFYTLKDETKPPVAAFRQAGVEMAVATDCNPGSSPVSSLLAMLNMACILFGLTPEEALAGATRVAARALGLGDSHGTLEVGKVADLVVWDIERPAELAYRLGFNPLNLVIRNGQRLHPTPKKSLQACTTGDS